jgi:hypothetical protein
MKATALFLLFAACRFCFAADTNIIAISDWSKPVGTGDWPQLRGRLMIAQGHSPGHAGAWPETEVYLEFENVSDSIMPMQIYFDAWRGLRCELRDANGKLLPQSASGGSGGGPAECWITLPHDSTIRVRANMSGYGKPKGSGLLLVLSPGASWDIQAGDTNDYFLCGTFTVTPPSNHVAKDFEAARAEWHGTLEFPKMKISVKKP